MTTLLLFLCWVKADGNDVGCYSSDDQCEEKYASDIGHQASDKQLTINF